MEALLRRLIDIAQWIVTRCSNMMDVPESLGDVCVLAINVNEMLEELAEELDLGGTGIVTVHCMRAETGDLVTAAIMRCSDEELQTLFFLARAFDVMFDMTSLPTRWTTITSPVFEANLKALRHALAAVIGRINPGDPPTSPEELTARRLRRQTALCSLLVIIDQRPFRG